MRVLLHTGKGGVGKTTLALATALGAARHGHRVAVLSTDSAHSLGDALGRPVGSQAVEIAPGVVAREIGVLDELDRSWSAIQSWLRELLREETDELVAEELLVFPGLEELMALRAIREVEASGDFDVCVVDCAPTGATLRMLRFPDALRIIMDNFFEFERRGARLLRPLLRGSGMGRLIPKEEFFDAFERLFLEVDEVRNILLDNTRTSARLVVNPSGVVIDEARRSFSYLSLYGVTTDAVLINRLLPESASHGYFARWAERERHELEEIEASFPVPHFRASLAPTELIGIPALQKLADEVFADRDPAERFITAPPIRMFKRGRKSVLEIDLPLASCDELDLTCSGRELHIRVKDARRRLSLPDSLVGHPIESAGFNDGVLEVVFEG